MPRGCSIPSTVFFCPHPTPSHPTPQISLTISPAMRSPATGGTKEMLPGVARRFPVSSWVGDGVSGGSGDQHTFSFFMSLAFSSLRMTLQRGQTEVFEMSEIRNCSGCSLLPVPMEEMRGIPCLAAYSARASLTVTVSIASRI